MMKLHQDLLEKVPWYKAWHEKPGHVFIHWSVFILIGMVTGSLLSTIIFKTNFDVNINISSAKSETGEVASLTSELLRGFKRYQNASGVEQIQALNDLTAIATERQNAMVRKIKNNPKYIIIL